MADLKGTQILIILPTPENLSVVGKRRNISVVATTPEGTVGAYMSRPEIFRLINTLVDQVEEEAGIVPEEDLPGAVIDLDRVRSIFGGA
jgi:hypothetical protein